MKNLTPEQVMNALSEIDRRTGEKRVNITTSQIRKFLAGVNSIYNRVLVYQGNGQIQGDLLPPDIVDELQYLKIKLIYQIGRNNTGRKNIVKDFAEKAELMERIDQIGKSKKKFIQFNRYVEGLVAYHKYLGGRD